MSKIIWGNPPERERKGGRNPRKYLYQEEAAEFRAHPGEWGQVEVHQTGPRAATSLADNIRRGREAVFRPVGAWEAKASEGRVWVRYVGSAQEIIEASPELWASAARAANARAEGRTVPLADAISGNGDRSGGSKALSSAGGSYPDADHTPQQDSQQDSPLARSLNETERRWHREGWRGAGR